MEKLKFEDVPEVLAKLLIGFDELKSLILSQSTPPPPEGKKLITRHEVRDLLRLKSLTTVDTLSRKGLLTKHQLHGVVRFYEHEVIEFANKKSKKKTSI